MDGDDGKSKSDDVDNDKRGVVVVTCSKTLT